MLSVADIFIGSIPGDHNAESKSRNFQTTVICQRTVERCVSRDRTNGYNVYTGKPKDKKQIAGLKTAFTDFCAGIKQSLDDKLHVFYDTANRIQSKMEEAQDKFYVGSFERKEERCVLYEV